MAQFEEVISILGCGNIGLSIAQGLVNSHDFDRAKIILTKRETSTLVQFSNFGYQVTRNNQEAVTKSKVVIICVTPAQLDNLLDNIAPAIHSEHIVISVVSGASIADIKGRLGHNVSVVRAMPNTAIQFCQSMTCLAARSNTLPPLAPEQEAKIDRALQITEHIFSHLGSCVTLVEEQIVPATALCACGVAFFCRAIRAAAQGGIEIGFHAEDAIRIASQTAKGAATLLLEGGHHPEFEIDKVTTPQGCTIAGLNQMEHSGFSSAMIKGIVTSAEKAASLYNSKKSKHSATTPRVAPDPPAPAVVVEQPAATTTTTTTTTSTHSDKPSYDKKKVGEQSPSSYDHHNGHSSENGRGGFPKRGGRGGRGGGGRGGKPSFSSPPSSQHHHQQQQQQHSEDTQNHHDNDDTFQKRRSFRKEKTYYKKQTDSNNSSTASPPTTTSTTNGGGENNKN